MNSTIYSETVLPSVMETSSGVATHLCASVSIRNIIYLLPFASDIVFTLTAFCKHPGIVTNGRLEGNIESTLDRFDVNTTLRYKCDTGYGLSQNSPSQRTCRPESLSWSGSLPICQRKFWMKPIMLLNLTVALKLSCRLWSTTSTYKWA